MIKKEVEYLFFYGIGKCLKYSGAPTRKDRKWQAIRDIKKTIRYPMH